MKHSRHAYPNIHLISRDVSFSLVRLGWSFGAPKLFCDRNTLQTSRLYFVSRQILTLSAVELTEAHRACFLCTAYRHSALRFRVLTLSYAYGYDDRPLYIDPCTLSIFGADEFVSASVRIHSFVECGLQQYAFYLLSDSPIDDEC